MSEVTAEQIAASETAAVESEPATPVETVATDTTETVAETDEQKNARELSEREERSKKSAKGVQRRFDELTADKYAANARADRLERLLEQAIGKPAAKPEADEEPKREQYAEYEDFVADKAAYRALKKAEGLVSERLKGAQQVEQQTRAETQAADLRQKFVAKQQEFAKTQPDYFEVVNTEDVRIPSEAAALLHTMDDAPQVIYHMAKNPAVAQSLWNESPLRQAVLLGQLSATLKGAPQVSKAPAPGKPTGARAGESGEPPSDMEGYMKWRAKQRSKPNG